jgi:hypothetical protein
LAQLVLAFVRQLLKFCTLIRRVRAAGACDELRILDRKGLAFAAVVSASKPAYEIMAMLI